jgi:hypothetical protein
MRVLGEAQPQQVLFSVPSGKLLGFIISQRSIEANPEKISATTNMKASTCIKDVQKLTGCVAALNRFISKLGERGYHSSSYSSTKRSSCGPQRLIKLATQRLLVQTTCPHSSSKKGAATSLPCCDYSRG